MIEAESSWLGLERVCLADQLMVFHNTSREYRVTVVTTEPAEFWLLLNEIEVVWWVTRDLFLFQNIILIAADWASGLNIQM